MTTQQDPERYQRLAEGMFAAWNSQIVEDVLDCYTVDVIYVDPTTRGEVKGQEAFRSYLEKLFSKWEMTWEGREIYPLDSVDGCAVLWRATLKPARHEGDPVTVNGMDLVLLEGDRIVRNDVYFDPSPVFAMVA